MSDYDGAHTDLVAVKAALNITKTGMDQQLGECIKHADTVINLFLGEDEDPVTTNPTLKSIATQLAEYKYISTHLIGDEKQQWKAEQRRRDAMDLLKLYAKTTHGGKHPDRKPAAKRLSADDYNDDGHDTVMDLGLFS